METTYSPGDQVIHIPTAHPATVVEKRVDGSFLVAWQHWGTEIVNGSDLVTRKEYDR